MTPVPVACRATYSLSSKIQNMKIQYINLNLVEELSALKHRSPDSLFNLVPFLTVELPELTSKGYSASSLFAKWKESSYNVNGVAFSGSRIVDYAKLFHQEDTKNYLQPTQTLQPNWSSASPIMLYMFKLQHNIKYEEWDKTDPMLKYLMPSKLSWLFDHEVVIPEFSLEELREIQVQALTSPTVGVRKQTSHMISKRTDYPDYDKLPRLARFMISQTWIYAPSIASNAPGMIRNLKDWDAPAEPISGSLLAQELSVTKPAKPTILDDAPW